MDTSRFFINYQGEKYVDGWANIWNLGEFQIWDKEYPNPAMEDALTQHRSILGGPLIDDGQGNLRRKKALVPGCGRGVDVLLLASFGYDAYGLECSAVAVKECKQEEARNHHRYPARDLEVGLGSVFFIQGDFFKDDWLQELGLPLNCFELIYDYRFFCALNPSMRPKWALRHTQLLAPSPHSNLICLEYPRNKDPLLPGSPWGVSSEIYMEHLKHPGETIPYDDYGRCKSDPLRKPGERALQRVAYWQPARTHDIGVDRTGEVQDRISVWRRE
ncbi:hypothetical protein ETB97_002156 [Aspergillus alliaceus]|uniref:Thiol methyltransferase n=1 Tax=Petromyces alliaceus TaxID=209559 RepID=A0A5N6FJT3_PETAA|nr:thiol methyltransferase [Aspergillus alliaceus]KAB8230232.1 thiol methyltransferase [Aspergillus alliaceus]KAE8392597.1 thiol methyltransferase [Aspergillus alliaceus]KAF5859959.1 hypothetical protein ETB97_002156 [Aspergillus burnettii]